MKDRGERRADGGQPLFDMPALSVAAHELKSPLALIRQLSLELGESTDPALIHRLSQQITLTAERSLRLTTNLSKTSKLQTALFEMAPIHPGAIIREVRAELQPLYVASGRELAHRYGSTLPLVRTNTDLLRRILCNFADNALHYADEEGVVTLYAQLRRKEGIVRLGVRDHGPMLPKDVWRSLQHEASSYARPDSSGVGLHVASRFAEAIDARIGAIRHQDGASFYVDVPVSTQMSLL